MYLIHLPKQGGGRMKNVMSFRASCDASDKTTATVWLEATTTLKGPDEVAYDQFAHVMTGLMDKHPVVIKLQEIGRLSEKEAQLASRFKTDPPPNVVMPICEFKCKNDFITWNKPLTQPKRFCSGSTNLTSVFVMEYLPYNLIDYATSHSLPRGTILKQIGFALLNLHINWNITHGDIASGNIMLDIGEPKILTYTIAGHPYTVNTEGYEVVFIDFQRSMRTTVSDVGPVCDDICLAYELLARWAKWPVADLIDRIGAAADLEEAVTLVQSIP